MQTPNVDSIEHNPLCMLAQISTIMILQLTMPSLSNVPGVTAQHLQKSSRVLLEKGLELIQNGHRRHHRTHSP